MGLPYEGLRVVELAHMIAGPACTQILAELGATVVKIEPPSGDLTRGLGPEIGTISALYASANRNKRSVVADLRQPEDARFVAALAREADIVVCNLDRAFVRGFGLDAASLRAQNPELIYVEVTGFGAEGPPGTDGLAQAAMGLMSITGAENGPSFRTGASVVDVTTGVWSALAVLAALENRRRTGRGDTIEVSLADVCLYMQYTHLALYGADPALVHRNGNHSHVACTPLFAASDGNVLVSIVHDRHWAEFCKVVALPGLAEDRRFANNDLRCKNQDALETSVNPAFGKRRRDEWVVALRAARLPCGPERSYAEVVADPALRRSGSLYDVPVDSGNALAVRLPPIFAETATAREHRVPALGEATAEMRVPR